MVRADGPRRRLLFRALAALGGLLIAALLAELVLRAVPLVPDKSMLPYRELPAPEFQGPLPNRRARTLLGVLEETNSLGLRDPERPLGGDAPRLALVGDSLPWGFGVPADDALPRQLEQRMPGVEVWTLAQPATNWANHVGRYARLAPDVQPDVVLGFVLYNDLLDGPTTFRVTPQGLLATPHRRAPYPDFVRPLLDRSALFGLAMQVYYQREMEAAPTLHGYHEGHLSLLQRSLQEVHSRTEAEGVPLVLALVPGRYEPEGGYAELVRGVSAWAAARDLTVLDLAESLGSPLEERWALPHDGTHPNAAGTARMAEQLAPVLRPLLETAP